MNKEYSKAATGCCQTKIRQGKMKGDKGGFDRLLNQATNDSSTQTGLLLDGA